MKLFTTKQIATLDKYTIEHEPITEIDLMERAAAKMFDHLVQVLPFDQKIIFFAGPGNNGGDAMALAHIFASCSYNCQVYLLSFGKPITGSPATIMQSLIQQGKADIYEINSIADFPVFLPPVTIIEGLFGSGLSRPANGLAAQLIQHINNSGCRVISIDIPGGLSGDDNTGFNPENIIRASETLTLQFPKLSLLFPENDQFAGKITVTDIGLHPTAIFETESPYYLTELQQVKEMLPERPRSAHKGTFGHALLIAGSYGKMGAAHLAAGACLRSGVGLLTVHVPQAGYEILQTAIPEAMCSVDSHQKYFSEIPATAKYNAIGIGPGLGTSAETAEAVLRLIRESSVPMVIDADAINILSENKNQLQTLPHNTILTPHPGEFKRLFGETLNSMQRLNLQQKMAVRFNIIIVLKGAYTTISLPDGRVFFNPTGNSGMATGGSGDVLTGIISGFLAQGLPPEKAAIAGVYIHGLAGNLAAKRFSPQALIASDIIQSLGKAFRKINNASLQEF